MLAVELLGHRDELAQPAQDRALADVGVVVLGETGPEIAALFEGSVPVRKAGSIEEAAATGLELAPEGGTVILAPACASQDMFRDYRERGERFARAAEALAVAPPQRAGEPMRESNHA